MLLNFLRCRGGPHNTEHPAPDVSGATIKECYPRRPPPAVGAEQGQLAWYQDNFYSSSVWDSGLQSLPSPIRSLVPACSACDGKILFSVSQKHLERVQENLF